MFRPAFNTTFSGAALVFKSSTTIIHVPAAPRYGIFLGI